VFYWEVNLASDFKIIPKKEVVIFVNRPGEGVLDRDQALGRVFISSTLKHFLEILTTRNFYFRAQEL
jgi:hypothetical protein